MRDGTQYTGHLGRPPQWTEQLLLDVGLCVGSVAGSPNRISESHAITPCPRPSHSKDPPTNPHSLFPSHKKSKRSSRQSRHGRGACESGVAFCFVMYVGKAMHTHPMLRRLPRNRAIIPQITNHDSKQWHTTPRWTRPSLASSRWPWAARASS